MRPLTQTDGPVRHPPKLFVPAKNSTLATASVKPVASAQTWMSAGARNIEPSRGVTMRTAGPVLVGGGSWGIGQIGSFSTHPPERGCAQPQHVRQGAGLGAVGQRCLCGAAAAGDNRAPAKRVAPHPIIAGDTSPVMF